MKPEEIIYYNELTGLVEPFTQKNIDDNDAIRLGSEDFCDYIVYPEELMDLLVEEYEVFSRTPDPNVNIKFELTHVRNYIAINLVCRRRRCEPLTEMPVSIMLRLSLKRRTLI